MAEEEQQEGSSSAEEGLNAVLTGLSSLREKSIIDEMRHRSLTEIIEDASAELKALDGYFHEKLEFAEFPLSDELLRVARSSLVVSLSRLCSHLSAFDSSTKDKTLKDEKPVRDAFGWILHGLMTEIEKFSKAIWLDGWELSVSAGLPPSVSIAVTLSFK